jgi:uncharacterized Zn-finger protein
MARIDEDPDTRDQAPLVLENMLDCPECDTTFDHAFTAPPGIFYKEDLVDAPREEVKCPNCGHKWEAEYEGWLSHEDAG